MWRKTSGWVICENPQDETLTHVFLTHLVGVFYNKTTQNALAMFYGKFLKKKNRIIRCFVWICGLPEIRILVVKVENLYCQFFLCCTEPILADF